MTPESQRIAIAEALGKRRHSVKFDPCSKGGLLICQHCGASYCSPPWSAEEVEKEWCDRSPMPNFTNDLNACHVMEKVLKTDQLPAYGHHLAQLTVNMLSVGWWDQAADEVSKIAHATAAQRCEAFLKTLGLWKETRGCGE